MLAGRSVPSANGGEAEVVTVYLASAVRTSAGPGPGVKRRPPAEAAALVGNRHALYGD